jgi:molybdopterin/thiamine biosynthesis adenylyltransferase
MLLNLLARQSVEIREIELLMPRNIEPCKGISPMIPSGDDLRLSLLEGVSAVNSPVILRVATPHSNNRTEVFVRLGPGEMGNGDMVLATTASGWSGCVSRKEVDRLDDTNNPIGAYVAASLCAGEIFKFVRGMLPSAGDFAHNLWLDAYSLRVGEATPIVQALPERLALPPTILAGVGAVANSFLHVLYALDTINGKLTLIDGDPEGITESNLNRCVLFGLRDLGKMKASTAAQLFADTQLKVVPVDTHWQSWMVSRMGEAIEEIVISAVDKNSGRHAIQDALPRLILGASTNEMRAQVNLYDVVNGGACLKCRNSVEKQISDQAIIDHLLLLSQGELQEEAQRRGVDVDDLNTFLANPVLNCATLTGSTLREFARDDGVAEWSVGFVSLLAGVLLAAEYLKLTLRPAGTTLDAQRNAFRFQFWRPADRSTNSVFGIPAEASCECQTEVFQRAIKSLKMARLVNELGFMPEIHVGTASRCSPSEPEVLPRLGGTRE